MKELFTTAVVLLAMVLVSYASNSKVLMTSVGDGDKRNIEINNPTIRQYEELKRILDEFEQNVNNALTCEDLEKARSSAYSKLKLAVANEHDEKLTSNEDYELARQMRRIETMIVELQEYWECNTKENECDGDAVYGFYLGVNSLDNDVVKIKGRNVVVIMVSRINKIGINRNGEFRIVNDLESIHDEVKEFITPNLYSPTAPEVYVKEVPLLGNVNISKGVIDCEIAYAYGSFTNRLLAESILEEIAKAYSELREELAQHYFNKQLSQLDIQQYQDICEATPIRVSGFGEYLAYKYKIVDNECYVEDIELNNTFVERCVRCLSKDEGFYSVISDFEMHTRLSPLLYNYSDEDYYRLALDAGDDEKVIESETFNIVEEMPQFPGGEQKLMEYLSENIQYPQKALEAGIQGRVFVGFVVEPDGSISNVKLLRGIGGGCDEEAIRVIESLPKWEPGKQRGKAVRVAYQLPVFFRITDNTEK